MHEDTTGSPVREGSPNRAEPVRQRLAGLNHHTPRTHAGQSEPSAIATARDSRILDSCAEEVSITSVGPEMDSSSTRTVKTCRARSSISTSTGTWYSTKMVTTPSSRRPVTVNLAYSLGLAEVGEVPGGPCVTPLKSSSLPSNANLTRERVADAPIESALRARL
jgi:hypothetical protein